MCKAATVQLMEKCNQCMFEPNGYIFMWNSKQKITLKTQSSKILHHTDWKFNTSASKEKQLPQPSRNPFFLDYPEDGYDYSKTMASSYQQT
jgi:hypothetical protein